MMMSSALQAQIPGGKPGTAAWAQRGRRGRAARIASRFSVQ